MVEAFIPKYEVVGNPRRKLQNIRRGPKLIKDGKPRISRVIGGHTRMAELRYVPLEDLAVSGFEPAGLPHVTREAALGILADAAYESVRLTTALKRKTAKAFSPTVKEDRSKRPLKLPPNATPYQRRKMEKARYRNELKRMFLNGEITFGQLALIMWGVNLIAEPNLTEPELPMRPFPNKKLQNLRPKELSIMRKKHRERLVAQGNIYRRF